MDKAPGSDIPEEGRQAAHVLLDALTGFGPDEAGAASMQLAVDRLAEVGAATVTVSESDEVEVDVSPLVGGALVLLQWMLSSTAGVDEVEVIVAARSFLDG